MSKNYELYSILGIQKNASGEEIKKAYRKKALENHPDKGGNEENFKKINFAYSILSDVKKKANYDENGSTEENPNTFAFRPDFFEHMFSDIFADLNLFDPNKNLFNINTIKKSPPILYECKVTLEELCTRKIKKLKFNRELICSCVEKAAMCNNCNGQGSIKHIRQLRPGFAQQIVKTCEVCNGSKKSISSCSKCKNGFVCENKIFDIHLTPEIENNHKYLFKDEGNQNKNCTPGDFIVNIIIQKHDIFSLENKDLLFTHNLSLKEALCGHELYIHHPSGEVLYINNKDITKPETLRIVNEKGMTSSGNIQIRYNIKFPNEISPENINILNTIF